MNIFLSSNSWWFVLKQFCFLILLTIWNIINIRYVYRLLFNDYNHKLLFVWKFLNFFHLSVTNKNFINFRVLFRSFNSIKYMIISWLARTTLLRDSILFHLYTKSKTAIVNKKQNKNSKKNKGLKFNSTEHYKLCFGRVRGQIYKL